MNHICRSAFFCVALITQVAVGQIRADGYMLGHKFDAEAFAFSPNSRTVALAVGQTVRFVELATGNVEATLHLDASTNAKSIWLLLFSGDSNRLAIAYGAGEVNIYDVPDLAKISTFRPPPTDCYSVALSTDLSLLAIGGRHDIDMWNLTTSTKVSTIKANHSYVLSLAFSPDGQFLASTSPSSVNWVRMWNIANQEREVQLEGTGLYQHRYKDAGVEKTIMLPRNRCNWWFVDFSPDGQKLVAVGRRIARGSGNRPATVYGVITVWRVRDGRRLWQYERPNATFQAASLHPTVDDLVVAGGRTDSGRNAKPVASIVDLRIGREIITLPGHRDEVQGMQFSETGERLATVTDGGKVLIWDLANRTNVSD